MTTKHPRIIIVGRSETERHFAKLCKILVVAGPTSSGKSDIAIHLAQKFNGEIISADSRQVYAGMDLGTGKVPRDEFSISNPQFPKKKHPLKIGKLKLENFYSEGVRHWLLDVTSPARQYSVARFKREAQKAIRDITRRGKLPIICGGTGFWIDAVVYDQSLPDVKPDAKLRAKLSKLSTSQLYARLAKLDPTRAAAIDRHNPVRLIRALEIIAATGKPVPTQVQSEKFKVKHGWDVLYLGMKVPKENLVRRIEKRLDARLQAGMVAEVRHMHTSGVSWKRLESFGLEYRWVARYLQKKVTGTEMRVGLLHDIIAYAKRQLTWWRKNTDIRWVTSPTQAKRLAKIFLNG